MTMTDDPDFLDELLSRYLDGDATDEDVARIEADPALVARVAELRAAIDLVAEPVTVPAAELDRIRAAAIAESATSAAVSDLDARRAEKLQRRNRVLAAAAVFVFLAVGYAAVQSTSNDDDTTADAGGDDSGDDASALLADADAADDSADSGDDGADMAEAEEADAEMATESAAASDDMGDADVRNTTA